MAKRNLTLFVFNVIEFELKVKMLLLAYRR